MKNYFQRTSLSLLALVGGFLLATNVVAQDSTYFSQNNPGNSFSDLTNWQTAKGFNPVASDLTDGANVFVVQDGHTVRIDSDLDMHTLIVGQGGSAATLDIDGTARAIVVRKTIFVDALGDFRPANFTVTHSITMTDASASVTNLGTFNPRRDANSLATFTMSGSGGTISGTSRIDFNTVTLSGGGTINTAGTLRIYGDLALSNSTTLSGSAAIEQREGNVTVDGTSAISYGSSGTFRVQDNAAQSVTCTGDCEFYNLYVENIINATVETKTFIGTIQVNNQLRVFSDGVFAGADSVILVDQLRIDNPTGWTGSGVIKFETVSGDDGNLRTSTTTTVLGTAKLVIDGRVFTNNNGSDIQVAGDVEITDGSLFWMQQNDDLTSSNGLNAFSLVSSARMFVRGINNFPSNFMTYTLDSASRVDYDRNVPIQTIRGGISYGYLFARYNTKNVDGGAITVKQDLRINTSTIRAVDVGEDMILEGDIVVDNSGTLECDNTVTLQGIDVNQNFDNQGTYDFNNLVITNPGPVTQTRVINLNTDVSVSGNFTATNASGDAVKMLRIDIDGNTINGGAAGDFTLGKHVWLQSSGTTQFDDMFDGGAGAFTGTIALDDSSLVEFDGTTGTQEIPAITYGSLMFDNDGNKSLNGNITINGSVDGDRDDYDFIDNGNTVTLFGNWNMGDFGAGQDRTVMTGDFIFAGADQTSNGSNFNNVTFQGSGTKTMNYIIDVGCTMTVENGIDVRTNFDFRLGCDMIVNGTGTFQQAAGTAPEFYFEGTVAQGITIADPKNTFVHNVEINNNSGAITTNSDFVIIGQLDMDAAVTLDITGDSLFIGADFRIDANDNITATNSSIIFDGNADQVFQNGNAATVYNNLYFRTGGEKRFSNNTIDVDGNVVGEAGVTINQNNQDMTVAGDWTHFGSIAGNTGDEVILDGLGAQAVNGLEFNTLRTAGTGTKTLGTNIGLRGDLRIDNNSELDVSGSNFNISIEGTWYNDQGGTFTPQDGMVSFIGANANIYSGGSGVGTRFNDLEVNLSAGTNALTIQNGATANDDLDVDGDLTITTGFLTTGGRDVYAGGNLTVGANGRFNGNNGAHDLFFDGSATTKTWTPGPSDIYNDVNFDAVNATWLLGADAAITNNDDIVVDNGKFDLNHHNLTQTGNGGTDVTINGANAEIEIDSGATWTLGGGNGAADFTNAGGTFTIVGTSGGTASLSCADRFDFVQTGGTMAARYYSINGVRNAGIDIQGGSIDATNNFSDGSFSGGRNGTSYLTIYNGAFGAPATISNVTFNEFSSGIPTNNVNHTAGQVLTFQDAGGNLSGPSRENDVPDGGSGGDGGFIDWTFTSGFFWVGADVTDATDWDRAANWSTGTVPTAAADVILDHSTVAGNYTVEIKTDFSAVEGRAKSITIIDDGSGITLDIKDKDLNVDGDVSIGNGGTIVHGQSTDTIYVAGSFSNSGVLTEGTGTIVFDAVSGAHSISSDGGSNSRDFNDIIVRGGATYTLARTVTEIKGDLLIEGGTVDIGNINNRLELQGNFTISDSGAFIHSNGEVRFEGSSGTQLISTGAQELYDVDFRNGSKKTLSSNLVVNNNIVFQSSTDTVNGGEFILFVNHDWRNQKGTDAFVQTGNGTVIFNGTTTQDIGQSGNGDQETIFNNIIFQNTGQKSIDVSLQTSGNIQILMPGANNVVEVNAGVTITGVGASNRLSQLEGIFRIEGTDFPIGYEDVDLLGGQVRYQSSGIDQNIAGVTYNNLRIIESTSLQNKEALGDITVIGEFRNTDNANSQFNMNCFTLTVEGSLNISGTAPSIDWGSGCRTNCSDGGTLVLTDIGTIDAQLTSFENLTINSPNITRTNLAADITVGGTFDITNNSTFDMNTFSVSSSCGTNDNTFILNDGSNLETSEAGVNAFPTGFGAYSISTSSLVEYQLNGAQTIFTNGGTIVYGDIDLEGGNTKTLDGVLHVDGSFDMNAGTALDGGANNMTFSGDLAVIQNYTYSGSCPLITFDGADQTIRTDNGADIDFPEVYFTGGGTKVFGDDEIYDFNCDFKVDTGVVIDMTTNDEDVRFQGDSILVNGTLNHNGGDNEFRFNKAGTQIVDLGSTHDIAHLQVMTGATVNIINNGLNVTGNGGTLNMVEVETGATLDLDTLTHLIGQDLFITTGTLDADSANLVFNQNGTQTIDAFTAKNVTLTGTGDKDMNGLWTMNDLTISGSADMDFESEAVVVIRGNLDCQADITRRTGIMRFEIDDTDPRTIRTNDEPIATVDFQQTGGNIATYTLVDDLNIDDTLHLGTGATLDLAGNTFNMGSPSDGAAESIYIESGADLQVDAGANLLLDCAGSNDFPVTVLGTLSLVGSPSNVASVARFNGGREIDIDVLGTGTIAAQYYSISNTVDAGIFVSSTASIDPTNNFSNGIFQNMQEGVGAVYLHIEADVTGVADIVDITFSHSGPTVGNDFNVRRDRLDGGILTFDDNVLGLLGSFDYENEVAAAGLGDRIVWPVTTTTNWIGGDVVGGVNDWFTAANWDNGVPDVTKDAVIGARPFNPIIGAGGADTAKAKSVLLQDNGTKLSITDGRDLLVLTDMTNGLGNENTTVEILNSGSDILVGGSWSTASNSVFTHGGAEVNYNGAGGSFVVDMGNSTINDLSFTGSSNYSINSNIDVDGNMTITGGANVSPSSGNYTYTVAGNWDATGGTFSTVINGTVTMDGATQIITNATFDNLTVAGTACDTTKGTLVVEDLFTITGCIAAASGSVMDINDDVSIGAAGSFDDGGNTHTFSGINWTGLGAFPNNTGTINFDRTGGTQNIFDAKFNSLEFTGTSRIDMEGDIDVTGDVTLNNTINQFYTQRNKLINQSGTGTFTLAANERIHVDGSNNFPAGFSTYTIDATSITYYDGSASNQTILGGVCYGNMILQNANKKTLSDSIIVKGDLTFNTSTLSVSGNNYNIYLAGNWNNDLTGSFQAFKGKVYFNGTGDQALAPGDPSDGDKTFWDVYVTNTSASGDIDVNGADIYIDSTLRVEDGIFTLAGVGTGWTAYVGGSLFARDGGTFATTGTYYMNSTVNSASTDLLRIRTNGSTLLNLTIDAASVTDYIVTNDLTVNGNFNQLGGDFDGNGFVLQLGTDINDAITINDDFVVGTGGELQIGNQTSLNVGTTGKISVVGSIAQPAIVTRRYTTGDYNFTVNGGIAAENYIFEYMSTSGISLSSTSTIDATNHFSNGTFTNSAANGTVLRIENTQRFTTAGGNRIENVSFPIDPGSGAVNVAKTVAVADTVEFYNAAGSFAGETKDNDPGDLIIWTGPIRLIWTGAKNTDWFDVANWSATSGPDQVPDSTFDVEIPFVTNQPIIDHSGADAKTLNVMAGALVSINTPRDTAVDLRVLEELFIEGVIRTESDSDLVEVGGNWTRINGGTYTYNSGGKILLTSQTGTVTINNGSSPFYDLEINSSSIVQVATDIVIDNDFTVTDGTFDITTSNNKITIGGSLLNNDLIRTRNGEIEFVSSGTETIDMGSSAFYNMTVSGTGTFTLANARTDVDNITLIENGRLDLAGNRFNLGDASGTDLLQITGGVFEVDALARLQVAADASISVAGGTLEVLGTDLSNRAFVTNQTGANTYNLTVANGGTLSSRFHFFDRLGPLGINFQLGSMLDPTNNLSYGTLDLGTAGGTFITFSNTQSLTGANRIEYLRFARDPGGGASNVNKTNATGTVVFYFSQGNFQGEDFDNDVNDLIIWDADLTWTGATSTDWDVDGNWASGLALPITGLIPTEFTDVIIPDAGTTPRDPILNVNGLADELEIQTNGLLTMPGAFSITATDSVLISGTLDASTSTSGLFLGGSWVSNAGTFTPGNSSFIMMTAATGTQSISTSAAVCGVRINSAAPSTATIETANALDIDCELRILAGTFAIANAAHTINLAGDWDNRNTTANTGFTHGNGSVIFDGASNQSLDQTGGSETFYDLTIANTGGSSVQMGQDIVVANDLVINNSATLDAQNNGLTITGNYTNNNAVASAGFTEGTGTVTFSGIATQTLTHAGGTESFNNLVLNNNVGIGNTALSLASNLNVAGTFAQTDGIITTGANVLALTSATAADYSGWGATNFINGNLRRTIATNTQTYAFPVAKGTAGTDYFLMEMINNSLTGTTTLTGSVAAIAEGGNNIDSRVAAIEGDATGDVQYVGVMGDIAAWTLTPNIQPTGGDYAMNLYTANIGGLSDDLFGILKRPDASTDYADWDDAFPAALPANGAAGRLVASGYATRSGFTSFSQFGIGVSTQALPIELLAFEVQVRGQLVDVVWTTATEKSNDFFTIERSVDGVNFEKIGIVKGAGNSSTALTYEFTDTKPLKGTSYYRLRQTDYDGKTEAFEISAVHFDSGNIINVYPNPATDILVIEANGLEDEQSKVEIFSATGELLISRLITSNSDRLVVSNLPSGVYTVVISNDNWSQKDIIVVTK